MEISILLKKEYSIRRIAEAMKRSHSSISREIKNNSTKGKYDPQKASMKALSKRRFSKFQTMKIVLNPDISQYLEQNIEKMSPELISGRIQAEKGIQIGKDSIYKYLYSSRGQHLCKHLRYKQYRKRKRKKGDQKREHIKNRVWIEDRPHLINEIVRIGDYEGDTMGRPKKASQQTLVVMRERKSRKIFAVKVPRLRNTIEGFQKIMKKVEVKSLTLDNGVENIRFKELKVPVYFCRPYSSWQKGSVENGIGLIRRYIPKKADLKDYSNQEIQKIIENINNRPMKCLNYQTPNEVFDKLAQLQYISN